MGIINLMPETHVAERTERRIFQKCLFLFPIILAGILVAVLAARGACNKTRETLQQTMRQHNETVVLVSQLEQAQSRWSSLLKQAQANVSLLEGVPRSYILATITNSLPEHAAMTRFEYDASGSTSGSLTAGLANSNAADGNIKVLIMGVAADNIAIGKFVSKLSANKLFSNVDLLSNQEDRSDKNLRDFQVLLDIRPDADVQKLANESGLPFRDTGESRPPARALPVSLAAQDGGRR